MLISLPAKKQLWKKSFDQHFSCKLSFPLCGETKKKFQLWTLGASYHNSCSMMALNGSRVTTAPWDFLCLYFERRLSKEFGLAKQDYAFPRPLLSFRTTAFALSDYFSFRNFSPPQNCREAPYRSDQWFGEHKNMDKVRASKRNGIAIRKNTTKNASSKDKAKSSSPVWKSANLAKNIFLTGP